MATYNAGRDSISTWTSSTYVAILMRDSYTFDPDQTTVASVISGSKECSVSGYSRDTLSTKVRTVDNTDDAIYFLCDNPDFGTLASGQNVNAMVVFKTVTNDSDSIPVLYVPFGGSVATNSVTPTFAVTLAGGRIAKFQ